MYEANRLTILDQDELELGRLSRHGTFPRDRDIEKYIRRGFVILDKPAGPTSHDVVATVKKILRIKKAGHSGTLDPAVSGVLPIAIEDGTKILSAFSSAKKQYLCNLYLDQAVNSSTLDEVLGYLQGQIYQFPPLKSNVAMRLRKRTLYEIDLIEQEGNENLLLVLCEAGTYIRTLCTDIGKIIGINGYMKELRRLQAANFREDECVTLHDLFDAYMDYIEGLDNDRIKQVIMPIEEVLDHLPQIVLKDTAVSSVCHGAALAKPGIVAYSDFKARDTIKLLTCKGELIGLGTSLVNSSTIDDVTKGFVIRPSRIIFDRDEYPQ